MSEVKKESGLYESFAQSKQTFPKVRLLEAINGNLVLRGRKGQRDVLYPIAKACKMFFKMFEVYTYWRSNGFLSQCDELKLVVYELGRKIQEAIAARVGGQAEAPPAFVDAKFMARLQEALKFLQQK